MKDHGATVTEPLSESWLVNRLPASVADTMTVEQRHAIDQAAGETAWSRHPVNIRFSLPWGFGRFYVTIVGGSEKRGSQRRRTDRGKHPLRTLSNILFFAGLATLFYTVILIGLAVQSAIVEF